MSSTEMACDQWKNDGQQSTTALAGSVRVPWHPRLLRRLGRASRARIDSWAVTRENLVVRDPAICHGQAVIGGTRVLVSIVLDALADGMTEPEILAEYPTLSVADIRTATAYGADLTRDEFPMVATPRCSRAPGENS